MNIKEAMNNKKRISEIIKFGRLIKRNFTDDNLSNMDLSKFPEAYWEDVIFSNTNLSNTRINFNPKYLPQDRKILDINLENVNLSNLNNDDFEGITIENCNLNNTGLNINFNEMKNPSKTLFNVKLDKNIIITNKTIIDIRTIENNPDYPFSDYQIMYAIDKKLKEDKYEKLFPISEDGLNDNSLLYSFYYTCNIKFYESKLSYYKYIKEYINDILIYLKKYNRVNMMNFIEKLCNSSTDKNDVFIFLDSFHCGLDITFSSIDFSDEDLEILNKWEFYIIENHPRTICFKNIDFKKENIDVLNHLTKYGKLIFENCTFDISYKNADKLEIQRVPSIFNKSKFRDCSLSNNCFSNSTNKKIVDTPFSCNTSAYLKLGNKCNGKCEFCKNKTENITETNTDKIIETLLKEEMFAHLNQIYFGGGEPTLYLDDIERIITSYYNVIKQNSYKFPDWYIFTNGSGDWEKIKYIINKIPQISSSGKIIISRHEIEDEKNENIIGLKYSLDDKYLKELIRERKVLFALTCTEKNIRDNFLKDYIKLGREIGIRNFIIQNLESKTDKDCNVEKYFQELEEYLLNNSYIKKDITSSSYFDLRLFKDVFRSGSIALKRYFDPNELEKHYRFNPKHSFDLGIDSNGDLYNDFQMVKKIKNIKS